MYQSPPMALLVEDDREIRFLVRAALEEHGWKVREAATLAYAREASCAHAPALIVLDLGMPDGDSVDFIEQMRRRSSVPIIVMAARVDGSEKMRAMTAGANAYLTKLFGVGERFNAVLRQLGAHPAQQHGKCQ